MSRWKAAGIHLSISFLIVCIVTLLIRLVLYPGYYLYISGGLRLLLLSVGVNVVVGPLLTFAIYKRGKKGLKFDLCFIGILQLVALTYGAYIAWVARPVYNVFAVDRFVVVTSAEVAKSNLAKARPEYQKTPFFGPLLVAAEPPASPDEQVDLVFSAIAGADIETYPKYYVPFDLKKAQVVEKSKPFYELRGKSLEAAKLVDDFLAHDKRQEADYRYLPLKGFSSEFMSMIVTLDGSPVTALAIDPW